MTKAGHRDRKIVFERASNAQDDYGQDVEIWSTWCTEWAAVYFGAGREQREAAAQQASLVASFEVLANGKTRALQPTDRLQFDGRTWDIKSVTPIDRSGVKVTAAALAT